MITEDLYFHFVNQEKKRAIRRDPGLLDPRHLDSRHMFRRRFLTAPAKKDAAKSATPQS